MSSSQARNQRRALRSQKVEPPARRLPRRLCGDSKNEFLGEMPGGPKGKAIIEEIAAAAGAILVRRVPGEGGSMESLHFENRDGSPLTKAQTNHIVRCMKADVVLPVE